MKFDASRAAALNKLNNFVEKNLSEYSKSVFEKWLPFSKDK